MTSTRQETTSGDVAAEGAGYGQCRFCGAQLTRVFADLGMSPLANSYLSAAERATGWSPSIRCGPSSARSVSSCSSRSSRRRTRSSPTMRTSRRTRVRGSSTPGATSRRWSRASGSTSEARSSSWRSNDGYLLQFFKERGVPVLGIEPAANVAKVAAPEGRSRRSSSSSASRRHGRWLAKSQGRPPAGQQRARPRARPQRLRRRHEGPAQPGGVDHDGVPAPDAADRRQPVGHDLPRALLLLFVHDRVRASSRRTAYACSTSRSCRTHGGSLRIYGCHDDDAAQPIERARHRAAGARGGRGLLGASTLYTAYGRGWSRTSARSSTS